MKDANRDHPVHPVHPGRLRDFPFAQYRDGVDQTAYFDEGRGTPVVFIHGMGANLTHFQYVAAPLVERCRVIGLDLQGFGATPPPPGGEISYRGIVEHVIRFLDRRRVKRAILVGHSFGGAIATLATLRHPERVAGLVLVNPHGLLPLPRWMQLGSHLAFQQWFLLPILRVSVNQIVRLCCPGDSEASRAFAASARDTENGFAYLQQFGRSLRSLRADLVGECFYDDLPRIEQPAHVVWGDADRLVPCAAGLRAAGRMPNAAVSRLAGIGHMPIFEQPASVITAVEDVLERVERQQVQPRRSAESTPRPELAA